MDKPVLASLSKYSMSSTQVIASDACQNSSGRQRGNASTTNRSSHNEYCGDHTLFVSRNAAMTRNASWANRGRRAAASPSRPIPARSERELEQRQHAYRRW